MMVQDWNLTASLWRELDVHGEEFHGSVLLNDIMNGRVVVGTPVFEREKEAVPSSPSGD